MPGPMLWSVPSLDNVSNPNGKLFRLSPASSYQYQKYGVQHLLVLNYPLDYKGPFTPLAREAFPAPYNWGGGRYVLNDSRVPHFSSWGDNAPEDDLSNYNPVPVSFADASPKKAPRIDVASSGNGNIRGTKGTTMAMSLDEEE